jgi:hypothetical protein
LLFPAALHLDSRHIAHVMYARAHRSPAVSKKDDAITRRQLNVTQHLRHELTIALARLNDLESAIREHRAPKGAGQIALIVETELTVAKRRADV